MRIAVVVLAGGQGTRIGGNKPLQRLDGRRLIDHALALAGQWSRDVAVSVRTSQQLGTLGVPLLADAEGEGPIAGIASALRFADSCRSETVLTIPCDEPFLPSDLAERLAKALAAIPAPADGEKVAIPSSAGRLHPATALWSASALERLGVYLGTGRRSLLGFAETIGYVTVEWAADPRDPFFNINSEAELLAAEALIKSR